jgi:site-specific recombinase XerD
MKNLPSRVRYEVTLRGRSLPKYFLPDEIKAILGAVKGMNSIRDHLILNMLWQTGARVSELLLVRPMDIDPYTKTIKIITLKQESGKKKLEDVWNEELIGKETEPKPHKFFERIIPLMQDDDGRCLLLDEIDIYVAKNEIAPSDVLFPIVRQRVNDMIIRVCRRAGIDRDRAHPHTFRHSFAIHLVRHRVPPYTIQQLMGHSDPSSTFVYAQVVAADARPFLEGIKW